MDENPAKLSVELSRLFCPGVIAVEAIGPIGPVSRSLLTAAELQFIAHCAEKRIRDFIAGRACAHRALAELGIEGFSLLAGPGREPLWPDAVIGSITHTDGYAAAVVARPPGLRGIGIDCEVVESVNEEIWSRICTPSEQERLMRLPLLERRRHAALIFAAKEAFYKCQFPLSHAWVGFEDVVIEPLDWPTTSGSLRVVPQKELPVPDEFVATLVGRFQFRDSWVIAGLSAPN